MRGVALCVWLAACAGTPPPEDLTTAPEPTETGTPTPPDPCGGLPVRTWFVDADGDGAGAEGSGYEACVPGPDAVEVGGDCDDRDPAVGPHATEVCGGGDEDCDGRYDDDDPSVDAAVGGLAVWADADGDGHGDPAAPGWACVLPAGASLDDADCDDGDPRVGPQAAEICDRIDDDCDGLVDDGDPDLDPSGGIDHWPDADGDGYGAVEPPLRTCVVPPWRTAVPGDCDDARPGRHPGASERCNGVDDDCDGRVDRHDPGLVDGTRWYVDGDGDGFGDEASAVVACGGVSGRLTVGGDCDDALPVVFPGAVEVCNGIDDDCDGAVDDADASLDPATARTFWYDGDLDGEGLDGTEVLACRAPPGYAPAGGDCDDTTAARHPRAREDCDGIDDDCDGLVDDEDGSLVPYDDRIWFLDADGDGFGDPRVPRPTCADPAGLFVPDGSDCDDQDPAVHPGDVDGDGWDACRPGAEDCDDTRADVFPDAPEDCDGADQDCDGHADAVSPTTDLVALGCDLCPSAALAAEAPLARQTFNPCVLDPAVTDLCSTDPRRPDTHSDGLRLHLVLRRTDLVSYRPELFLFLPSGAGDDQEAIPTFAAQVGFKVVRLGLDDDADLDALCAGVSDDTCWPGVRREGFDGTDATPELDIGPADALVGRLSTVLAHLAAAEPGVGWEDHLLPDGTPRWSSIVVAGWSGGAGLAAFAAREAEVAGAWLLSGPQDRVDSPSAEPSGWLTEVPFATPGCAIRAAYHPDEAALPPDTFEEIWRGMGVTGGPVDVLSSPYPWADASLLWVDAPVEGTCAPADTLAREPCLDEGALAEPYLHLLCDLGDLDPPTCP